MATLLGTSGTDLLTATGLAENISALEGNDTAMGDGATNIINGGSGNDAIYGMGGADWLFGGDKKNSNDKSNVTGTDVLNGGAGDDLIFGGTFKGNDIPDSIPTTIKVGNGNGNYDDTEFDLTTYLGEGAGVTVHLANQLYNTVFAGSASGTTSGTDTLIGIEGVIGTSYNDTLIGPYSPNQPQGQNNPLTIFDTTQWQTPFIFEYGENAGNSNYKIGYYIHGEAGDDVINGLNGDVDNSLTSLNGLLRGGIGNDTIFGGDGDDVIYGGEGNDVIDGGAGFNMMCYDTSNSGVTANLATGTSTSTSAGNDTLSNITDLSGSNFNDILTGDDKDNMLIGLKGNDTLTGGLGHDIFVFNLSHSDGQDVITDFKIGTDVLLFTSAFHTVVTVADINSLIQSISGDASHTLVKFNISDSGGPASIDFQGVNFFTGGSDGKAINSIADFGPVGTDPLYFTQLDVKPFDVQSTIPIL